MSQAAGSGPDAIQQLPKAMGFWDVLLFNIATVLGPRWVASAAHNGTSSVSLWIIAAVLFFLPSALVINELSSRFPEEGGLYVWTKEAFGDFHGFVAGWNYWTYTVFYFPGLLMASAAMSAYIVGENGAALSENRTFLMWVSVSLLVVAVGLNIIGLNIGKWLQNVGGVATYLPLMAVVGVAVVIAMKHGAVTHLTRHNVLPHWNWDTLNFWSQIAFAFSGLELVSAMSQEVRNPRRTLPRALYGAAVLIAAMYILATVAVLVLVPPGEVSATSGVFHAITVGSIALQIGFLGIVAAIVVTLGNAGGVGSTVAGIARVPFVVGIDRYLPQAFGKIHPRWKTPYVAILIQAILSCGILFLSQINESTRGAYDLLVSATNVLYFITFLYMFAAAIRLASRKDRAANPEAILIPGGKAGVWVVAGTGFLIVLLAMFFSMVPPGESANKFGFEVKLLAGTVATFVIGLVLYLRGARGKTREAR